MRNLTRAAIAAVGMIGLGGAAQAQESAADFFRAAFNQVAASASFRPQAGAVPREVVAYPGRHAPGTIVVSTSERRLYLVQGDGTAIRYGVGVGRPGFTWGGNMSITRKAEWPDWTPPPQMLKRRPDLPRHMKGGPDNPLGARALYLGSSLYRIHGSNEPETIGQAVSSGCIRMTNADVIDLYGRVRVGTRVVVVR
ncbi:MAG: L,D-transpeptidase [Beijerinckiaceae bacterium]